MSPQCIKMFDLKQILKIIAIINLFLTYGAIHLYKNTFKTALYFIDETHKFSRFFVCLHSFKICIFMQPCDCLSFAVWPFVNVESILGHWKLSLWKTLSRLKIFRSSVYMLIWRQGRPASECALLSFLFDIDTHYFCNQPESTVYISPVSRCS